MSEFKRKCYRQTARQIYSAVTSSSNLTLDGNDAII